MMMKLLFPTDSSRRRRRLFHPEIIPVCSFQDEGPLYLFLSRSSREIFGVGLTTLFMQDDQEDEADFFLYPISEEPERGLIGAGGGATTPRQQEKCPSEKTGWRKSVNIVRNEIMTLPRGTMAHLVNVMIAILVLVWFISYEYFEWRYTKKDPVQSSSFGSTFSVTSMRCIYLSQLGLIYDNGVNAFGRYVGEGRFLRILNKYRFVWHVTAMPLLAIPVTEIATRQSVYEDITQQWIVTLLIAWSLIDFAKWNMCQDPKKLRLVDVRSSQAHQGSYLSGTLAYTSEAFWELVLPPVILVLYELLIGTTILWSFSCMEQQDHDDHTTSTTTTTLDSAFDASVVLASSSSLSSLVALDHTDALIPTSCVPPTSAICLVLSGILTLLTSGTAKRYPELQLLGENLHGMLLWAAYVAID